MNNVLAESWPFEDQELRRLMAQLNIAEAALQKFVGDQSDVVIDPLSGVPVLLREAQQALSKSEIHHRRLANILQNVQDGVIVTDLEGRVTYWNKGASAIYGYAEGEMLGQSVVVLCDDADLVGRFLENTRNGTEYNLEWEARRKDGSSIWVQTHMTAMRDSDNALVGALRISKDIADRKRVETALQVKSEELQTMTQQLWQTAKLATMGELAASIAHELNNPLATVQLRVEALMTDLAEDAPAQRALEIVAQEADRMASLVANLLQFSRRSTKQISTADVCEEIQNTLALIQYHFLHRHIKVVNTCANDLPMLPVDRQQLRQLFLNLFANASDAMPEGGILSVRAIYADDQIVVEVSDTGPGISPENLARVMEPFFTTKPEGKGTGLGLPICRRIAQEHGGTFELESDGINGHGTTARIRLPLRQGASNVNED